MARYGKNNKRFWKNRAGFSLIELMIVVAIIGILATQVFFSFTSPDAILSGDMFNLKIDLNLARSEAVSRNQEVLVDFVFDADLDSDGDTDDGYRICIDNNSNNSCGDAGDEEIKSVPFADRVAFYDTSAGVPTDGTSVGPPEGNADLTTVTNRDGVTGANFFKMKADGTCTVGHSIIAYVPDYNNSLIIDGDPRAVVISIAGRVRAWRWYYGAWSSK